MFMISSDRTTRTNFIWLKQDTNQDIFYGHDFAKMVQRAAKDPRGATVFGYYVKDPERYGVVDFDKEGKVLSLEEKPTKPKSHYAVVGLYFYDNSVLDVAANLKPSARGEYEITDVNKDYLAKGKLSVELMGRGVAWLDTGTHDSLVEATNYVKAIEDRQGLKISCIEEIAYRMKFINKEQLTKLWSVQAKSTYGEYLKKILDEETDGI